MLPNRAVSCPEGICLLPQSSKQPALSRQMALFLVWQSSQYPQPPHQEEQAAWPTVWRSLDLALWAPLGTLLSVFESQMPCLKQLQSSKSLSPNSLVQKDHETYGIEGPAAFCAEHSVLWRCEGRNTPRRCGPNEPEQGQTEAKGNRSGGRREPSYSWRQRLMPGCVLLNPSEWRYHILCLGKGQKERIREERVGPFTGVVTPSEPRRIPSHLVTSTVCLSAGSTPPPPLGCAPERQCDGLKVDIKKKKKR